MTRGGITLAAVLVLGLSDAAVAREDGFMARETKGYPRGFQQPKFTSDNRASGKPQTYIWPVSDRYRGVSRPSFKSFAGF